MIAKKHKMRNFIRRTKLIVMITKDRIWELAHRTLKETQDIFKHLHEYPELAFHEVETSRFVRQELMKLDIPFREGYAQTGLLGVLRCQDPQSRIVAIRADMDALPIEENTNLPYGSKNKGVMHACGHDAHTATLLGVAKILASLKEELNGTFLFIFQPAEERYPGGANTMLRENVFAGFTPDLILGLHVIPSIKMGQVGFRPGLITASSDGIQITVKGKGGHAALLKGNNAILAASNMLLKLQTIPNELAPVKDETILAFGRFIANGARNVIPESVKIDGTLRTLDPNWRKKIFELIGEIATEAVDEYGCSCQVEIDHGYPSVMNDEALNARAEGYAQELLGEENVTTFEKRMTGEDFGYFSQKYPSLFFRVGIGSDRFDCGKLHTSSFIVDPEALLTSTATMTWLAIQFISEKKENQQNTLTR